MEDAVLAETIEVKVPDIGTPDEVDVIEVFIKPGDRIAKDDSLITLESDKASMEIPSPESGVVESVTVKVGDKIAEGGLILKLATTNVAGAQEKTPAAVAPADSTTQGSSSPAETPTPAVAPASKASSAAQTASAQEVKVGS